MGEAARNLRQWILHTLALGPLSLQTIRGAASAAVSKKKLKAPTDPASVRRALDELADSVGDGRYALKAGLLHEAKRAWPHYTAAQRATLALTKRSAGIEEEEGDDDEAEAAESGGGEAAAAEEKADEGEEGSDEAAVRISSVEQCQKWKKRFRAGYKRYVSLDAQLATNTKEFDALSSEFSAVIAAEPDGEEAREFADRIASRWARVQPDVYRKLQEYRSLHVELRAIKQAVNAFVEAQQALDEYGA